MIRSKYSVEFTLHGPYKNGVGGVRARQTQFAGHRLQRIGLLGAEQPRFSCVGVEGAERQPRLGKTKMFFQRSPRNAGHALNRCTR